MSNGDHRSSRDKIIDDLHRELVGPDALGETIDCGGPIKFEGEQWTGIFGPWRQKGGKSAAEDPAPGDEILCIEAPTRRYGIGVLYPSDIEEPSEAQSDPDAHSFSSAAEGVSDDAGGVEQAPDVSLDQIVRKDAQSDLDAIEERQSRAREFADQDDTEVSLTNVRNPSALGISFLAECQSDASLGVTIKFGTYERKEVSADGPQGEFTRDWWIRTQNGWSEEFKGSELLSKVTFERVHEIRSGGNIIKLALNIVSRAADADNKRLITVSLVNRTAEYSSINSACIFQCELRATVQTKTASNLIHPYPRGAQRRSVHETAAEEEDSFELLYSKTRAFSVGHGCCGNWESNGDEDRATAVFADVLPKVEVPNVTPELFDATESGSKKIEVSMRCLAGLDEADDGFKSIAEVLQLYERWISGRERESQKLNNERHKKAAARHVLQCKEALQRMRRGFLILQSSDEADLKIRRAFKLANHAMLLQQLRSDTKPRPIRWDSEDIRIIFEGKAASRNVLKEQSERGNWRPFQIAFLLLALESTARGDSPERKTIELIWFPTGGGKTEAYLGLTAFSMFLRRLSSPADAGTQVLMRYTLRLLTAQQFQRAAALVCAMEVLRQEQPTALGSDRFRIGIWLGRDTTPNTRGDARAALRKLTEKGNDRDNSFVLLRCPWCNAPMGLTRFKDLAKKRGKTAPTVIGYRQASGTVVYHCPDQKCHFHNELPVVTIDEDIYDFPPEIVIGTVDKFAQLSWDPRARRLFGIDSDGSRNNSPPGLIIQDELHLISGPLGSMVGIYELVIEELCTDRRTEVSIPPKIVTSTATIRRYRDQIKALFARPVARLFPPPGLDAYDNFFSRRAQNADGSFSNKIFIGAHGTTLGSLQTAQVRVVTTLLQSPIGLELSERDPWWTLLIFFNSLRELGTTVSLFQSDIPYRLLILMRRYGLAFKQVRRLTKIKELTSRLNNSEVPQAIDELSTSVADDASPVDACLASSIIEVGVDIDRLSLMLIVGQPKTVAQYIQVAGRVGRRWWERPGLVVTLLSPSKPRDRSHYEKFRASHERLYAEVEPTSVTPYSPPAVERALHAVLAAYVRQIGDQDTMGKRPMPFPEALVQKFTEALKTRVKLVDGSEWAYVERALQRRITEWKNWHREFWDWRGGHKEIPLMRMAGTYANKVVRERTWATQNSMRNVDAECRMMVTQLYIPPAEGV
jgi:Helicase conserved C-terminal domain